MTTYLIALGANISVSGTDLASTLQVALAHLGRDDAVSVEAVSPWYQTPAWPPGSGPDFVNGAAALASSLEPIEILQRLHNIERGLGRERQQRWAARVCDLDLLAADDRVLPDPGTVRKWMEIDDLEARETAPQELILPHPRLHERSFVLAPLRDIAPQWRHPILEVTVDELYGRLLKSTLEGITRLPEET